MRNALMLGGAMQGIGKYFKTSISLVERKVNVRNR